MKNYIKELDFLIRKFNDHKFFHDEDFELINFEIHEDITLKYVDYQIEINNLIDEVFVNINNENTLNYILNKFKNRLVFQINIREPNVEELANNYKILIKEYFNQTNEDLQYFKENDLLQIEVFIYNLYDLKLNKEILVNSTNFLFTYLNMEIIYRLKQSFQYLSDSYKLFKSSNFELITPEDVFSYDNSFFIEETEILTDLIDYSDIKAKEKIIALKELGILDYLKKEFIICQTSTNKLSEVLSLLTGEKASTIQSYINPMNDVTHKQHNNPYSNTKTVEKTKDKLINIGISSLK
ncbi:hypothetical protein [Empedobacter brevis]|uniref:hypothetical protein n=1 Tax=Empedobacter brevis TaxID=247 RepID=UPI0028A26CCC|nr:hypothetical protein [Empedobacter brevis]